MFVVAVTFEVEPEKLREFTDLVRGQARNSLSKEPGCHQFDVCVDPEDETKIFLYELYTDEDAFKAHTETSHFAQFGADSASLVRDKTVATLKRIEPAGA